MAKSALRLRYKQFLARRIYRAVGQPSDRSAMVIAPHQDDETLGCGGLICRKTQVGAPVWVVYLTDGGASHLKFKSQEEMSAIRRREALSACRILGVPETQVTFLNIPNGALDPFGEAACHALADLLQAHAPEEVYLPCRLDFHHEHHLTWAFAMDALAYLKNHGLLRQPVQVYEYPIWYFHHWPWTALHSPSAAERKALVLRLISTVFGLRALGMFNYGLSVEEYLPVKRAALRAHASQTTQFVADPHWLTLDDVWDGEFVERFLQPYEIFKTGPRIEPD